MKTKYFILFGLIITTIGLYIIRTKGDDIDIKDPLPLKIWENKNETKPILFYLSGDAGLGPFSKSICKNLYQKGYDIYALNSKVYFWHERDSKKTAEILAQFLEEKLKHHKNQEVVFIGYSFGADAIPFIINQFPTKTKNRIHQLILLDPYETADLEIHYKNLIFENVSGKWNTIPEINQLPNLHLSIILSDYGKNYPFNKITLTNKNIISLGCNHHFNRNYQKVTETIIKQLSN
ncbi:AcvB/VirJ family lysyl-phosphatidylglycerol hydrolase [Empedobacter sp. UBA7620]|uniref:AcvB/VirJ family lysyl-phosphatidylglycerol hydrolase n=1 Tax=Empedobacter sp. UBA7620 TaxID=1946452 RepID=UPI0025C2BDBA|nr:AcvB/VirJ family lysyl-phosphatidylglycerol hydrolase [Empedobacter sp. UBA7620]